MSFSVSLDGGAYEYAGSDLRGLFAQPENVFKRAVLVDDRATCCVFIARRRAISLKWATSASTIILTARHYGRAFIRDHLYPMAAAIWSTPAAEVGAYPAASFIRFCENHGLLKLMERPIWRTVRRRLAPLCRSPAAPSSDIRLGAPVLRVARDADGVEVRDASGGLERFDAVVIAAHADSALRHAGRRPATPSGDILGAFRYAGNIAYLHSDARLMPRRKAAWASWNYLAERRRPERRSSVTYWMNRLQPLGDAPQLFVTLNPLRAAARRLTSSRRTPTDHPQFDLAALHAQRAAVVAAGRGPHLVLRRLFRRGLSRGWAAGGPRRRRTARRPQASLGRAERERPHLPRTGAARSGARPR